MKRIRIFVLCFIFFVFAYPCFAQVYFGEEKAEEIPPWMEEVPAKGNNKHFIPKGTKKKKFGSQVFFETSSEYTARKVYEIEGRLNKIEERQEGFKDKLEEIKNIVEGMKEHQENLESLVEGLSVNSDKNLDETKEIILEDEKEIQGYGMNY